MNNCSLRLLKINIMKNLLLIKVLILLPVMVFIDYLLMVLIGTGSQLFGFGDDFYCGTYCDFGKLVLGGSIVLFFVLIFKDLKAIWRDSKIFVIKWDKINYYRVKLKISFVNLNLFQHPGWYHQISKQVRNDFQRLWA